MSEDATIAGRYAPVGAARALASPLKRFFAKPLLPEAGASGAPLTAVIAVVSFLAALALAALLAISAAAATWTDALNASITVQIKAETAAEITEQTEASAQILSTTPGVVTYDIVEPEAAAALLEPWLGKSDISQYLNVPALIDVTVSDDLRTDLDVLRARLSAVAPGAVVDDHRGWRDRLAGAARGAQLVAFLVFVLIMGATCAIAVFAARAGLAANEEVVSLLHLVGASDVFIANEVQRRFLILGLRGSAIGLAAALVLVAIASVASGAMQAQGDFLPAFSLGAGASILLLVVPAGICLVMAVSARTTVLQTLKQAY